MPLFISALAFAPTGPLAPMRAARVQPIARSAVTMESKFDKRVSGKIDVSYSVANVLNGKPEEFKSLERVLKAAEKELKSQAKAKTELGVYRFTDNVVG